MTSVEDRLRAATRAAADTVAPDSAPPLRLPGKPATHGPGFTVWRHRARWHRAVAPLAAAAAVIAVVAASVTLTHAMPPRAHSHRLPAGTVPLSTAPSFAAAAVPAYYVALEPGPLSAASTRAVVRATATGATLATVRPPRPYYEFTAVTVAADDRTFVLAAQQKTSPPTQVHGKWRQGGIAPARFFLLHLDPAHRIARLTALPISEGNGSLSGIALSPDGTRLAVAVGLGLGSPQEQGIRVITLRTGLVRTWTWRAPRTNYLGYLVLGANPLSWTADGRMLAFEVVIALPKRGAYPGLAVRLLDTTAPGRSLQSSRVVARFSSASTGDAMITPDGSRIVVPSVTHTSRAFTEYSTATGKRVAILGRRPYPHANDGGWPVIYWVSPSGGTLIAYDARARSKLLTRNGGMVPGVLAVVSGGRFLPLPGSDSQAAW